VAVMKFKVKKVHILHNERCHIYTHTWHFSLCKICTFFTLNFINIYILHYYILNFFIPRSPKVRAKIRGKQMQWQHKKIQKSLENQTKMTEVKPKHTESEFPLCQHILKIWIILNSKQCPHWYNSSKRHWTTLPPSIMWDFLESLDILG